MEPPVHKRPSPKTRPVLPLIELVPWKYSTNESGMPAPTSASESADTRATPVTAIVAPAELTEFAQPCPAAPALAHGQALVSPLSGHVTTGRQFKPNSVILNVPQLGPAPGERPSWIKYFCPHAVFQVTTDTRDELPHCKSSL